MGGLEHTPAVFKFEDHWQRRSPKAHAIARLGIRTGDLLETITASGLDPSHCSSRHWHEMGSTAKRGDFFFIKF